MLETLNSGPKKEATQRVQFGNFDIMNDAEGRPLSLGKGTFGRTYQACHRYLDTIVALKIINERYATDAGVRQRFLVEARAVARLSHPHIARLYDFGEVDGVLHYAMEYCGGGSLADHVAKNGPLGVRQVLEVGQQIAGALKCAHNAGFIHRDLKPSNIMLTEGQEPLFAKLIDFGLVQPSLPEATQAGREDQSADGARFLGTPLFASPEQLKEEPMDIRTDLFSLGMTLWYLLLARAPDGGSSAEIAARRLSPESYGARLPSDLPVQLRDVLARLLEKDRRNRFASAAEVFAAFNLCATALGFRRARDYTTAASEAPEWEEAEPVQQRPAAARAEPVNIERIEAELSAEFKIVTRINDDFTGTNYIAEPRSESGDPVFLHVLNPALVADISAFERFRMHVTQLKMIGLPEILQPRSVRAYSDYVAIVMERPKGSDLMSILRAERVVHLVEAAPLLESIADGCDRLAADGLPGVQLAAAHIYVEWPDSAENKSGSTRERQLSKARPKLYPRFLAVSEAPDFARLNEPEDASSTMTTDMLGDPSRADNMCEHFGTLLYRIVAGRNCPIAASLSSQAYIPVPGLSEQANRTLSLVIAKQIELASCGQVLREILGAEGIVSRSPGHPSAGFTVPGSGSTVVPPSATPPFPLQTPPRTSTASTASSSRFRPMPVAPSASVTPPPTVVPPSRPIEPATNASTASAPPPVVPTPAVVLPSRPLEPATNASGASAPPPVVPPLRPIEASTNASTASAPPPPKGKSVEAAGALLVEAKEPPAAEALKPLIPARETTPAPSVTTREPAPKPATPTNRLPTEGETKVPTPTLPKTSAKKSQQIAAKTKAAEPRAKEEKARTEPVPKAAPSHLDAVTVVSEKIVAVASPASSPKIPGPPPPIIPKPNIVQNAVPWVGRNVRPIGIGIAALLAVSVTYGLIQKIRFRNATDKTTAASSVTQQRDEPALKPAKNIVPPPAPTPPAVVAGPDAEQDKIKADRLLAERALQEQKTADEAKLAARKAADDAKLLAEQQKVDRGDESKLVPGADAAANAKTQEGPKAPVTQKQAQKDSQSSRDSGRNRTSTTSQSANRPAPAAPRNPPAVRQKPANTNAAPKNPFQGTAPGG